MHLKILKPRKALNKAFLKIKPNRVEIENFNCSVGVISEAKNRPSRLPVVWFNEAGDCRIVEQSVN